MTTWSRFRSWLDGTLRRSRLEREMDAELRFHMEAYAEDLVRSGVPPQEAMRRARMEFGGVEQTKEECRDALAVNVVDSFLHDVRFGLRMLGKSRGLTTVLALTLALGIGVNTAIFSVLNGWLLRPLPVPAPEQLTVLAFSQQKAGSNFSYPDLLDFRKQTDAFSDLFAYGLGVGALSANGKASEFAYSSVTGNYFSALRVKPVLGRFLLPGEGEKPGEELLVVLGHSYWQKKFDRDPGVVGRQVLVNGKSAMIIGVAPNEFHGTLFSFDMDGYLPLSTMALDQDSNGFWNDRYDRRLTVLGRLKPGLSLARAQSSVDIVAERLTAQFPATNKGVTVRVIPERLARPAALVASFVPVIATLFLVLAALVLLLACINVANIQLARATVRQREMAIRSALGGSRGRLIRQMLTESLVLALLGGIAGVALGKWVISASGSILHSATTTLNFAYKLDSSLDWRVFAYTLAAAVFTAFFVGIWPAFRASRANVNAMLHEGGRSNSADAGSHRFRSVFVVTQVAGSLIVLIVSGLFVRSLNHAEHMYLGFDPDHVLNLMLDPHQIGYDKTRTNTFYRELENRVRAMPGVQSASLGFAVPLGYPGHGGPVYVEGVPLDPGQQAPEISYNSIDHNYLETMRIPLLRGRAFAESDSEMTRMVAIVNQTLAKMFWPNKDPIGKRFSLKSATGPFIEVVGMASDGQYFFLSPDPQPYFYLPLAQNYTSFRSLQIRSTAPPESLITEVQEKIRTLAPDLPIIDVRTMEQILHGLAGLFVFRLAASLATVMGILGLTLAVIGVYGVVSFSVTQRTHEIGIRMALGARRGNILKLSVGQGLALVTVGVVAGLFAAWATTRAMTRLLVGVSASDPVTYVTVVVLLLTVTLLACWIPARRAMSVDPMIALRHE